MHRPETTPANPAAAPLAAPAEHQPLSPDRLELFTRRGHLSWLRSRIRFIGSEWVEMENDCRAELAGPDGALSSAAVFGMVDSVCGMALWTRRGIAGHQVTIDLRVDFMRPAPIDRTLIVRAWCTAISGQIAYMGACGYDEDPADPVCTAAASFMMFDRTHP